MGKTVKILLVLLLLAFATPAFAADEEQPAASAATEATAPTLEEHTLQVTPPPEPIPLPSTYSPDYCEFSVGFPDEPTKTQQCENNDPSRCYDLISYTHTYEMAATVNFRIICNPIDKEIYEHYSAVVMEGTLKEMTKRTTVKTYDTSFREEKNYKQAGLVGETTVGRSSTIYIAQLWIGNHSALSLEAEMVGEANPDADLLYSSVLKSVNYNGDKKKTLTNDENKNAKKEEPKKEKPVEAPQEKAEDKTEPAKSE